MFGIISSFVFLISGVQTPATTDRIRPDLEVLRQVISCGPSYQIAFIPGQGGIPQLTGPLGGPSLGITVAPWNQTLQYLAYPDLRRLMQQEPTTLFSRCFRSDMALKGESSPGMPAGWITNFDIKIEVPKDETRWRRMKLVYPNGAKTDLIPLLDANGWPTGDFEHANGDPFLVRGVPGKTINSWESIEDIWDPMTWVFKVAKDGNYRLSTIKTLVRKLSLDFYYDVQGRLTGVASGATNKWVSTLNYSPNGYLDSIVRDDKSYVKFYYEQNQEALKGKWVLRAVTGLSSDPKKEEIYYYYKYKIIGDQFLLSSISRPSASLKTDNWSVAHIQYDDSGKVIKLTDANGNSTSIGSKRLYCLLL